MSKHILLIQGHPDASRRHLCHAPEDAEDIRWAEHLLLFFPLWLGEMPALLKGFLEQVARPGFAFPRDGKNPLTQKVLAGRSARVVVTMGMPALMYR